MASPVPQAAIDAIAAATSVDDSVIALLGQFNTIISNAVQKALENGATKEELQPVSDALAGFAAKTQAVADAVAANTPAANMAKRKA